MTNWLRLNFGDTAIECLISSETESARVRKIKETWTATWAVELPKQAVFYDVGANIGIMSLLACERTHKGVLAVAIEPALTNLPGLFSNVRHNRLGEAITILPVGLGARTCVDTFLYQNAEAGGALHSFGKITQFKPDRNTLPVMSTKAICYALDDIVRMKGMPFPTHLKIDVDGTELAILQGATETLRDPRLLEIQVEAVDFTSEHEVSRPIVELVEQAGFVVSNVYDHSKGYPWGRDFRFARKDGSDG